MAVEITFRLGSVTPTSASGITMGEPAYNTVDNRLFVGKGFGITAAWVGAPISNDYLQIAAGLTQEIPTLSAVKDYVNYIGTIGATGATGAQGVQGVTGSTGAQGNTGPVGDYVVSFNGSTGAITFSNYAASVNGLTGAIVSVGLTSGKLSQFASTTSAELAGVVSDETGSGGVLVFNSSPSITTAINTASASFNLLNTTATSLFIGSAATTGRIFGYTGTLAATQSVTVAGANTGVGVNKTVNIGTGSGLNGSVTINIGQTPDEGTGIINLLSNTAVSGTLSTTGSISAPNIVNSWNGSTGAVTFSSYVTSFNGITGAVTGVTAGGANTFTALNSFSAGLSAAGGVTFSGTFSGATASFSKLLTASAGISASSVAAGTITSTGGITFGSATNFMAFVPQSSATNGGLWIKEGVFQIGGSALLQGSGSVNYSGNTEHLYVYGYQIIDNAAAYQGARTGLTVKGGTGQSVPLFNVTRGGTSAVQVDQNGTLVAAMGLSAAGGVTFSGNFSGATASFSKLLSASAGVSASALTVTTTGTTNKTSSISMASGVTASNQVVSQITLNAYNADSGNLPPAPYTRIGYITADVDYDLRLRGGGDSYISILNDSISIGDVDGNFGSARISFDTTEYVTVNGKLSASSGVFTDSVVASAGLYNEGTLYINCDWNNTGEGGGNSITHIGDLAGDINNTFITVNDSTGNITVNASNGTVALSGVVTANSQVVSTNARGWFL